ncbi:RNA polymerase sigma-70 factor, ECF subfamily [Micromonospora rhizosphaerae]|uniref:RNA polymerase sigma-70 factor, ECF subfamily n=1 Tax=Micromonospora rhizosphaerae TaxID=568872 RepID=A0A1C6RJY0_9ACTN|nr:RNA polymerase sigma-70 factor, ECF subfamily [Micromonospora rhizosphaerae]
MTEEDYRAFYASAFARLVGQVYLLTGDFAEAQDAVQEAFVRGWSRRRRFADGDEPEAWIRTVARRIAVSRWRSARSGLAAWRRHGPVPHVPAPGVETPLIVAALQRLPEEQRRAIVLHHLCDRSVDQVAAETGVPAGTVKARLSRGRSALRQILDEADASHPWSRPDSGSTPLAGEPRAGTPGRSDRSDDIITLERRHA